MDFQIWLAIIPAIVLFIYGIDNFSKEIQAAAGTNFEKVIRWGTKGPIKATFFGALVTAIIQSSAATTIIAMGLVNSGIITFSQSVGLIFGSNIGTTLTAQLVAFNLITYAPILIVAGFVLSLLKTKYNIFGKPIFYLGLLFFALSLISASIAPLKNDAQIMGLLAQTSIPLIGIIAGFVVTNIFQSSTITTGLLVVLAQAGLIDVSQAIPIIFGANIGTTVMTLAISSRMDVFAKRTAVAHFLFNFIGVLIFIPFVGNLSGLVQIIGGNTAQQVANAHLIFNIATTLILILLVNYFVKLVEKIVPTTDSEISLVAKNLVGIEDKSVLEIIKAANEEFKDSLVSIIDLLNENKNLLLATTKNTHRIDKLEVFTGYIYSETRKLFIFISKKGLSKEENQQMVQVVRCSKISSELGRLGKKISEIIVYSKDNHLDFSIEAKQDIEECFSLLTANLILVKNKYPLFNKKIVDEMRDNDQKLNSKITQSYKDNLSRLYNGKSKSASLFAEILDLIQDTDYKIRAIRKIVQ